MIRKLLVFACTLMLSSTASAQANRLYSGAHLGHFNQFRAGAIGLNGLDIAVPAYNRYNTRSFSRVIPTGYSNFGYGANACGFNACGLNGYGFNALSNVGYFNGYANNLGYGGFGNCGSTCGVTSSMLGGNPCGISQLPCGTVMVGGMPCGNQAIILPGMIGQPMLCPGTNVRVVTTPLGIM